ncbi:DUF4145 domain-containing protein [Sphingomonas sp. DT-204]|uniref:DUF4145 domain-containing protein n=1 Tax=Sphingomonas sp. DT-204 TaxID=3396166 RepID=UPI003F1AA2D4
MAEFTNDCPHCLTRGAGFRIRFQWESREALDQSNLVATCGVCNHGIIIASRCLVASSHPDAVQFNFTFPGSNFQIEHIWPAPSIEVPSSLPKNVESFYTQGIENIRSRRWDAAGAMFRKALDVATKLIDPEKKANNLYTRINDLVYCGLLTPAMGEWSHEIRIDGNESVHGDEPESEQDANIMQRFTEAFLRYAFTMPAMVAESRANREMVVES